MRDERGQVMPLMAVGLLVLLVAFLGAVVDVGSWYQAQRHMQAVADAAALAAVQKLPGDTSGATALARQYAATNGGTVDTPTFTTSVARNDTVTITARETAPAIFTRLIGFSGLSVHASATARAEPVTQVAGVVPLAVNASTPQLQCGDPCFGDRVTLPLAKDADLSKGAFALMDLDNGQGNAQATTLGQWLTSGYPSPLPLGMYQSSPGDRYHNNSVDDAIDALKTAHKVVLMPVYDYVNDAGGANEAFDVIGFAAFRVDDFTDDGSKAWITGAFQHVIEHGATGRATPYYYGVSTVALTQ